MQLIIGGSYNGKLDFTLEKYKLLKSDVCDCKIEDINYDKKIIYNFEYYILKKVEEDNIFPDFFKENMEKFQDKIIICSDISNGVVPNDVVLRKWREAVGRSLCFLKNHSDFIIRVFFGIGTELK